MRRRLISDLVRCVLATMLLAIGLPPATWAGAMFSASGAVTISVPVSEQDLSRFEAVTVLSDPADGQASVAFDPATPTLLSAVAGGKADPGGEVEAIAGFLVFVSNGSDVEVTITIDYRFSLSVDVAGDVAATATADYFLEAVTFEGESVRASLELVTDRGAMTKEMVGSQSLVVAAGSGLDLFWEIGGLAVAAIPEPAISPAILGAVVLVFAAAHRAMPRRGGRAGPGAGGTRRVRPG